MQCKDIMAGDVRTIGELETVQDAARLMRDANVGFLPVVDDDGFASGTITDRDIAVRYVADGKAEGAVADYMSTDVVSCGQDETIERAGEIMADAQVSRLIVCDDDGRPVGIISLSDLADQDAQGAARTLQQITEREAHP